MNLPCVERGAPTAGESNDKASVAVDALGTPAVPGPRDLPSAQRVACAPHVEHLGRLLADALLERPEQSRQQRLDLLARALQAGGAVAQLDWQFLHAHRHVDADA